MKVITLENLRAEGVINAPSVYERISQIGGFGSMANYFPDLDLSGVSEGKIAQIEKVIADAKPKAPELQEAALLKMRKDDLVALAADKGIQTTPDSQTIPQIVDLILKAGKN